MTVSTWVTLLVSLSGVITLLYFLRLRRRQVEVPFSPLWRQVLLESQSNSLFRMLKRFMSWLIQLIFLSLILTALADPVFSGDTEISHLSEKDPESKHTLILMDTSASMQAMMRGTTRFSVAQTKALEAIDQRIPNEVFMLATAGRDVTTETGWTENNESLKQIVRRLQTSDSTSNPVSWTQYARNATRGLPNARVVLITDQEFPPIDDDIARSIHLEVIQIDVREPEKHQNNVAIVDFIIRSHLGNSLKYAIYYKLKNTSHQTVTVDAYLHVDASGTARNHNDFRSLPPVGTPARHTLAPGEEKTIERVSIELSGVRAALILDVQDIEDVLQVDNVAFSMIPQRKTVQVALVGPRQMFVEAALKARNHVNVVHMPLQQWTNADDFDLVVFNGVTPSQTPQGNSIWLNTDSKLPIPVDGTILGGPLIVPSSQSQHPAMKYVRFIDLEPRRLLRIKAGRDDTVLARTKRGSRPAIVAHSDESTRWLVVAFDPVESEWVAHYSFSVFFVNAINWFFEEESRLSRTLTLARPWNIKLHSPHRETVEITTPSGEKFTALVDDGGQIAFSGMEAGFYEIRAAEAESYSPKTVAATMANVAESTLRAEGQYVPYVPRTPPEIRLDQVPKIFGAPAWQVLLLIALTLTVVEWLTYNRRWTI